MIDSTHSVQVDLGPRSYQISIGTRILDRVGSVVKSCCPTQHAVVVTDENVEQPHAMNVAKSLQETGVQTDLVVLPSGESTKSIEVAEQLWKKCLEVEVNRKSIIVAVGGGVIGDLAGFIAATYARGLRFLQIPTTLLAQVDSSVGGKVGINLPDAKNMVGAFWQPTGVLIDTATLDTLPAREYRAGLAEVVKYGVILDEEFFEYLERTESDINQRKPSVLIDIVERSCQLKAKIVSEDEREESGLRAVLNYGHTFAHALESVTGYRELLHGEAVSIGMLCASRLAEHLGRFDHASTERQATLLKNLGLPVAVPQVDHANILKAFRSDKKSEGNNLRFVLPSRIGKVELVEHIDPQDALGALGN
ncbi:MAG: 3-dehydroquinate synthase [Pirellulales bacterium]|nr:3-dehydroquinate synthase [Pirellulales bacterium]